MLVNPLRAVVFEHQVQMNFRRDGPLRRKSSQGRIALGTETTNQRVFETRFMSSSLIIEREEPPASLCTEWGRRKSVSSPEQVLQERLELSFHGRGGWSGVVVVVVCVASVGCGNRWQFPDMKELHSGCECKSH